MTTRVKFWLYEDEQTAIVQIFRKDGSLRELFFLHREPQRVTYAYPTE